MWNCWLIQNCVNSFLEKRGCSHAQLIIESMWVEHVLTAQNKMAIWTHGILWGTLY